MRRLAALLAALLVGSAVAAVPVTGAEGTTIDHDGDALTLSAGPAQQISGQTDLGAGENVTVRVTLDDTSTPLVLQETATVGADGRFAVTADLHVAEPGATGNVTVRADGEELNRTPLRITECDGDCEPVPTDAREDDSPFSFEGEAITLSAAAGQTIDGQTDLTAGESVTVRLQSTDTESPFLQRATTTVGEGGHFSVEANLSVVEPGTEAQATLRADGETLGDADVVIEGDASESDDSASEGTSPALESSIVHVQNGQTTAFTVDYGSADVATLSIHSDGADGEPTWEIVATIHDSDDDGTATVRFDTQAVGSDAPTLSAAEDDLTITSESTLDDDGLDPADYYLTLDIGSQIDDPTDIGTVVLTAGDGTAASNDGDGPSTDSDSSDSETSDSENADSETSDSDGGDTVTDAPPADDGGMQDASLVGGSVLGLLTLFGVRSRLLS